jgi:hypothetical protein
MCCYLTVGGCLVTVFASDQGNYSYHCFGCTVHSDEAEKLHLALSHANQHAALCRTTPDPHIAGASEIAREVTTDLRAEFPHLDARAAAGLALSAQC